MSDKVTCSECVFWERIGAGEFGTCWHPEWCLNIPTGEKDYCDCAVSLEEMRELEDSVRVTCGGCKWWGNIGGEAFGCCEHPDLGITVATGIKDYCAWAERRH